MKPKMKRVNFDRVIGLLMIIFFTNVAALATYFYLNADFGAICLGMAFVLDGLSVIFVNELYHEVELKNKEAENEVRAMQSIQRHAA